MGVTYERKLNVRVTPHTAIYRAWLLCSFLYYCTGTVVRISAFHSNPTGLLLITTGSVLWQEKNKTMLLLLTGRSPVRLESRADIPNYCTVQ
jgi:hypothetical protein